MLNVIDLSHTVYALHMPTLSARTGEGSDIHLLTAAAVSKVFYDPDAPRKPTNLTINTDLRRQARERGLNPALSYH